ncbi:MAG: U32 family peptidase [Spartobacteria bacterium]|nr:U32 family peptidase [Spartobacteria bacterium]
MNPSVEIMAPAGNYAALSAAIRAGAGSVYFGVGRLNMRARAAAFQMEDLKRIVRICRWCRVRSYLTVNTIVYDEEMADMKALCDAALSCGVTAIIASDIAVIQYAHTIGLEVHISVQTNICNMTAVRFYAQYADVMVLARECTLPQIQRICRTIEVEQLCGPSGRLLQIEIFAHGALCVAVSGKCYMSLGQYNSSANRGACFQTCRRKYRVIDDETGDELVVDNHFVMSPKDLCTIDVLDRLLQSGVSVLKIEGRGRTADYVSMVVSVYREAVEAVAVGGYTPERIEEWKMRLGTVYNRGFWQGGYYCGEKLGEWSASGHSQSTLQREQLGVVSNYFSRIGVMEFTLKKAELKPGDVFLVEGSSTGVISGEIEALHVDGKPQDVAVKDDVVTLSVADKVRRGDKVFRVFPRTDQIDQ